MSGVRLSVRYQACPVSGFRFDVPNAIKLFKRLGVGLRLAVLVGTPRLHLLGTPLVHNMTDIRDCLAVFQIDNYFTEMCSGSEAGPYSRLIDVCITEL